MYCKHCGISGNSERRVEELEKEKVDFVEKVRQPLTVVIGRLDLGLNRLERGDLLLSQGEYQVGQNECLLGQEDVFAARDNARAISTLVTKFLNSPK